MLFGFFPGLFRGHRVGAVIIVLLGVITWGLAGMVFAFVHNKMYVKHLLGEACRVTSACAVPSHLSLRPGINLPVEKSQPSLSIA